jgi:acetyl esterase/lipase
MKTRKFLLFSFMLMISVFMTAQNHKIVVELWPNGAPNSNGLTGDELMTEPNRPSNITKPIITIYPSSKPGSKAIIMCPGGGYIREAIDHEGHDMAAWVNSMNITYIVLEYRLPNGHSDVPLTDVHQAICITREHAKEWNLDPQKVGIMGASAGGHLAACAANFFTEETRPDFQILLYPVITMKENATHMGSRINLLGKTPTEDMVKQYSMESQVTDKTPHAFITFCSDDNAVPPINSISYYMALLDHHVSATLHAYPAGGHGFGFRDNFKFKRQWTGELEKWLGTF